MSGEYKKNILQKQYQNTVGLREKAEAPGQPYFEISHIQAGRSFGWSIQDS